MISTVQDAHGSAEASGLSVVIPLGASSGLDGTIVVAVAIRNSHQQGVQSISDDAGNEYFQRTSPSVGVSTSVQIWSTNPGAAAPAIKVTVTLMNSNPFVASAYALSGVASIVNNKNAAFGSIANPSVGNVIDSDNAWIVAAFAGANSVEPTAGVGNLREALGRGHGGSQIYGALVDNTATLGGSSVLCLVTHVADDWAGASLELTSV